MKGLLVKDFCLMLQRKRFFLVLIVCAFFMGCTIDDSGFIVGWMCLLMAIFSLSTLSYDEYDNCMPFLMSLPVSSKDYAKEKYLFGFLCGCAGWLLAVMVELILVLIRHLPAGIGELLLSFFIYLPLIMMILSISIPVELKWGAEKGRTYMLVICGLLVACVFAAAKLFPEGSGMVELTGNVDASALGIIAVAVALVLTALSILISIRIVSKKEF